MARGRKRKGALTDAETLRAYEAGQDVHALAASEGVAESTILGRVSSARQERDRAVQRHHAHAEAIVARNARQRPVRRVVTPPGDEYGLRSLAAAVERLAAIEAGR